MGKYDGVKVTYEGVRFYPSTHDRCTAACWWCASNYWNWLKQREAQMATPTKPKTMPSGYVRAGGPAFSEAARTSVKP